METSPTGTDLSTGFDSMFNRRPLEGVRPVDDNV